ncbi:MAG: GNAT family N-acetyltransferase [Proteobacteria bacterium]|nr:GNAT family N-acetyltransferase [Pseudomonadota bacterium]
MRHKRKTRETGLKFVDPAQVLAEIEPGMNIFLGTGAAEPRTLVKHLMSSDEPNLQDLSLIQLVSLGEAMSLKGLGQYRLKTFFSGWVASEAITAGQVDLIPGRYSRIEHLISSGRVPIDVAMVQVTPPDEAGYCSLGLAADVSREAMARAAWIVGEVNDQVPFTLGDTLVHYSEFDHLVRATEPPFYFPRWPEDETFDRVGANVASIIEDGDCLAFSIGPLYEALATHLVGKKDLGIHSPFITDALMNLIKSGAVTNRGKDIWRGKSVVCYAFGSPELMAWLDRNPLVEFQPLERVFSPLRIGRNHHFVAVLPARKVDLSGQIALHVGKGNIAAGPGEVIDFFNGAELSRGGKTVFALPSRNRRGEANIRLSIQDFPNLFNLRESVSLIVTEWGVANMVGRTVRERAQALIEIAHPDDRPALVEAAKEARILYPDQLFLAESAHLYPTDIDEIKKFKGDLVVRFRAIRPSDEEEMRRLFYGFSDEAVYYRYFSPIKTMPHAEMQRYVNVDYRTVMSVVGLLGEPGQGRIIAEGRYVKARERSVGDVAFVVDEEFHGRGIASFMLQMLVRLARERGLTGFTADVLGTNRPMMKVFEKSGLPVKAKLVAGEYEITIPFEDERAQPGVQFEGD